MKMNRFLKVLIIVAVVFSSAGVIQAKDYPQEYEVMELLKIVDGDTVDVRLDLGFQIYHDIRVRMNGINTPESRTTDLKEKYLGYQAKDLTKQFLESSEVIILKIDGFGKYGRALGDFSNEKGERLNQQLIDAGLALEYHGEGRSTWWEMVEKSDNQAAKDKAVTAVNWEYK